NGRRKSASRTGTAAPAHSRQQSTARYADRKCAGPMIHPWAALYRVRPCPGPDSSPTCAWMVGYWNNDPDITLRSMKPTSGNDPLSLLSFNMQVGVGTKRYHQYITRGWRHLLPSQQVLDNLGRIAELIAGHDFVGLQELDAGIRRSGHLNQLGWLA